MSNCYTCRHLTANPIDLVKTRFNSKLKVLVECHRIDLLSPKKNRDWLIDECDEYEPKDE